MGGGCRAVVGSVVRVVVGGVAGGWWVGVRVRTWRAHRCVQLPALQVRAPAGPPGARTCWASQSGYLNLNFFDLVLCVSKGLL